MSEAVEKPLSPVEELGRQLMDALSEHDPEVRVERANKLLDAGADPAFILLGNSTVNVLLGQRHHQPELEAPLLHRLLEGGADVNHQTRRGDAPVTQLLHSSKMKDVEMVPFYDVIFSREGLNLDVPVAPETTRTIRETIHAPGGFVRKLMRARVAPPAEAEG